MIYVKGNKIRINCNDNVYNKEFNEFLRKHSNILTIKEQGDNGFWAVEESDCWTLDVWQMKNIAGGASETQIKINDTERKLMYDEELSGVEINDIFKDIVAVLGDMYKKQLSN